MLCSRRQTPPLSQRGTVQSLRYAASLRQEETGRRRPSICKSEIQKKIQALFNKFIYTLEIKPFEVEVMANFAYVIADAVGTLKPKSGEPDIPIRITCIWLLKKQADGWKIYRQLANNKPSE